MQREINDCISEYEISIAPHVRTYIRTQSINIILSVSFKIINYDMVSLYVYIMYVIVENYL